MKYLLSILCLFIFSCDSSGDDASSDVCDSISGNWQLVAGNLDYEGNCENEDYYSEISNPNQYVSIANNTLTEYLAYTEGAEETNYLIESCESNELTLCNEDCFESTISFNGDENSIILETIVDIEVDCILTSTIELTNKTVGCTDTSACNYNPYADEDDGSCAQLNCNNECGGNNIHDNGCHCDDYQIIQDFLGGMFDNSLNLAEDGLSCNSEGRVTGISLFEPVSSLILPENFGDLTALEYFNVSCTNEAYGQSGCGNIVSLPESIGDLINLEYLNLSGHKLTSLPNTICDLPEQCYISVSGNNLCPEYNFSCIDLFGYQTCEE